MKRRILTILLVAVTCAAVAAPREEYEEKGDSCLLRHGTFNALRNYTLALQTDSSAALMRKIARCHYMRGQYALCVKTLLPVAGPDGDSLSLEQLRYMFNSYRNLGNIGCEVMYGKAILRRSPMDAEVTAAVAKVYNAGAGTLPDSALALTGRYLSVDSTNVLVLREHADAQFILGRFDDAIASYRRLYALGDSTYNTVYSIGMAYTMTKSDSVAAYRWLKKAAEKSHMKDAGCLYRLGIVCIDIDSVAEGISFLQKAYELMRPDGRVMFIVKRALGEGFYKQGDYWNAIYAWREALRYDQKRLATIFNIAQTYALLNKTDDAKAFYRSFLSMAVLQDSNPELDGMIAQAEDYVGKRENFNGNIVLPPLD